MVSNKSCFMVTWIIFKNHFLHVGLTQNRETMALWTLTNNDLFYVIQREDLNEYIFVKITFGWGAGHIWLHTTLQDPWPDYMILEVSWNGIWSLSFELSQFHGHGSWLVWSDPNTKLGDHGTLIYNHWFILVYHAWGPAWIKFIEIVFGWGPGHIWLHSTLEGPWPHYMNLEVVLGRPLDTFCWAPTISWSRLLACVWSGPYVQNPLPKQIEPFVNGSKLHLGPLHTRDWKPMTNTLQALSLVGKAEPVQVCFTLRLRDQQSTCITR
jgi:hypothetical protein